MDEQTTGITPEKQAALDKMAKVRAGLGTKEPITGVGRPRVIPEDKTPSYVKPIGNNTGSEEPGITIPKSEFQAIMDRLNKLENPGVTSKAKRSKSHIGHLRMWEDKLVTRIGQAKENMKVPADDPMRMTLNIETTDLDGKKEKLIVAYLDFLNTAPTVAVKFKKFDKGVRPETDVTKGGGGVGNRAAIDKEGRLTDRNTGEEIEFEVNYTDISLIAEVVDGEFAGKEFPFEGAEVSALNA